MGSGSSTANIFLRKEERAIKVPQFWDLGQGFMGKGSGKGGRARGVGQGRSGKVG